MRWRRWRHHGGPRLRGVRLRPPEGMTIEHCILVGGVRPPGRHLAVTSACRSIPCRAPQRSPPLRLPGGHRLCLPQPPAAIPVRWTAPRTCGAVARRFSHVPAGVNVPGDPVARVTAAYRASLDALAEGRAPDPGEVRAVTGREYTRGHFAPRGVMPSRGMASSTSGPRGLITARLNPYHATPAAIEAPAVLDRGH